MKNMTKWTKILGQLLRVTQMVIDMGTIITIFNGINKCKPFL